MKQILRDIKRGIKSLTLSKLERRHGKVGKPELWKMKRDFQIQFLKAMGLNQNDLFLDIGCGTLRGGIPVIEFLDEGNYYGVDVRESVIVEGRKELYEAGLESKNPTLLATEDVGQLTIAQKFDFIWAFSVLIHLTDEILQDTISLASRHLSSEGVFYANVNVGESRDEANWQGFPVVRRPFAFYEDVFGENGLSITDTGSVEDHGHFANFKSQDSGRMLKASKN